MSKGLKIIKRNRARAGQGGPKKIRTTRQRVRREAQRARLIEIQDEAVEVLDDWMSAPIADADELLREMVENHGATRRYASGSDKARQAVVALAYRFYDVWRGLEPSSERLRILNWLRDQLPEKTKISHGAPLRLFLRTVIDYQSNNRLVSRDAKAIEYAISERILPNDMRRTLNKKGEGLDAWSRRAAKSERMTAPASQADSSAAGQQISCWVAVEDPGLPEAALDLGRCKGVISRSGFYLTLVEFDRAESRFTALEAHRLSARFRGDPERRAAARQIIQEAITRLTRLDMDDGA